MSDQAQQHPDTSAPGVAANQQNASVGGTVQNNNQTQEQPVQPVQPASVPATGANLPVLAPRPAPPGPVPPIMPVHPAGQAQDLADAVVRHAEVLMDGLLDGYAAGLATLERQRGTISGTEDQARWDDWAAALEEERRELGMLEDRIMAY